MMTASSLEFFPCRVQLMGLPRSAGTPGNGVTTPRLNRNVTAPPNEPRSSPPMAKLHAISRNLFGTPDPIEMNHLYQEETQRQRSYVMQRYNIDIETAKPTGNSKPLQQQQRQSQQQHQHQCLQPTEAAVGTFAMPTLIEQELQQHEQRLQKEKCNLIRAAGATVSTKQMTKGCNSDANIHQQPNVNLSGAKIVRSRSNVAITTNNNNNNNNNNNCCKDMVSVPLAAERYKPYERQTLITDCYSLRKNKSYVMGVNGNKTTTITTMKGKNNQKMLSLLSPCSASSSSSASASSSSSSSSLSSSLQQNLQVLKATVVGGGQQPADIYLKLTNDDKINVDNERNNNNNNNNNNYYSDDNNSQTNNHHNDNDDNVVDIYRNNRIIHKVDDDDECVAVDVAAAAATTTTTTPLPTTVTVNGITTTSTDLILKVSVTAPPKATVNANQCNNTTTAPQTQNQA